MYTVPYQVSLDPRVCIVRSAEDISQKSWFQQLDPWKNPELGYAWTMNIYVSHNQILESLALDEKGNVALFDFLDNLCTAINKAMGGVNNLEPVIDEETQTINIIDSSYSINKKPGYLLELYGYSGSVSNFVRSFDLKTEITNDFATMATIGSTAGGYVKGVENTMFSKWNKGLIDPWKEKYIPPKATSNISGSEDDPATQYANEFWNGYFSPFGYTVNPGYGVCLNDEIIDKNVAIVTEFYKYMQAKAYEKDSKYSSPTNGFIPISLGVTMDGLSGIKIYNAVNVDTKFLPKNYPDNLQFIIKGVNHKLSDSDWETNFETVVISRNEYETDKTYPFLKTTVDEILQDKINPVASWVSNIAEVATGISLRTNKPSKTPPNDVIQAMKDYGITTPLQRAHFLAQISHESGQFKYREELASGAKYEGRVKGLGNTQPGDGKRYKGRGYIQLTGRANYKAYNDYLKSRGIKDDVLLNPTLVATKYAADVSAWYWAILGPKGVKKFNKKADQGSSTTIVTQISIWVNGGTNGLQDRIQKFNYYWSVIQNNPNAYT